MKTSKGLMMLRPSSETSEHPTIDQLTRQMVAAFRAATKSEYRLRGVHRCACGVWSDNRHYWVDGVLTNSLCVHYLAFHRQEVPMEELVKVKALRSGEEHPTDKELAWPRR